MLRIEILGEEYWDEEAERFRYPKAQTIELEHSLVSLSLWESKWNKPFLTKKKKTDEEILDYIKCMTLTPGVDEETYRYLSNKNYSEIDKYISATMTATTFSNNSPGRGKNEIITAEVIYHWMVSLNIPSEYENWHLNRLITLIRVCSIKNSPPKKMSHSDIYARNAAINARNKAKYNTRG